MRHIRLDRYIVFVCLHEKWKETRDGSLVSFYRSRKEKNGMTRTKKQDALPEGMAIVETADGRWFPACAPSGTGDWVCILKGSPLLPPALDSLNEPGQGYNCREVAVEAYRAWREATELPLYWRGLAARTELYPERNAWYLDEMVHLAGDDIPRLRCGISVYAVVLAAGIESVEIIDATANTPAEAIETLYQRVYEWFRKQ
jgi:hypothetical protein